MICGRNSRIFYFSAEEGEYNNRSRFNVEGEDFFLVDGK